MNDYGILSGRFSLTWDTSKVEYPPLVNTMYQAFLDCRLVTDGNGVKWRITRCERTPGRATMMEATVDMVPMP